MRFIFILLTLALLSLLASEYDAFLDSSDRVEVYAQDLLDQGRNEEALLFIKEARVIYSNSAKILIFGGDAAFGTGDIDMSKQYYQAAINILSEAEVEAIVQDHIEGGYVEEASLLLEDARGVYPQNASLLVFSGRAAYELSDLTTAKKYYILALELDANNEIAAASIENIEGQEEAQENKVVSAALEYLGDKGLDFLMIFLAFLGGELLAKRYLVCESTYVIRYVKQYIKLRPATQPVDSKDVSSKLPKRPFCYAATVINYMTIAVALLIIWIFINIMNEEFTALLGIDLTVMTENDIWRYTMVSYMVILVFIIIVGKIVSYMYRSKSKDEVVLATAQKLQEIALDGQYMILREACRLLVANYANNDTYIIERDYILHQCYSDEARSIIENAFIDVIAKHQELFNER